jgi:hypothetical protein
MSKRKVGNYNKNYKSTLKLPSNVTRTRGRNVKRFGVKIRFRGFSLRIGSAYKSAKDAGKVAAAFRKTAFTNSTGEIELDLEKLSLSSKNEIISIYLPFTTTEDQVTVYDYLVEWLRELKKKSHDQLSSTETSTGKGGSSLGKRRFKNSFPGNRKLRKNKKSSAKGTKKQNFSSGEDGNEVTSSSTLNLKTKLLKLSSEENNMKMNRIVSNNGSSGNGSSNSNSTTDSSEEAGEISDEQGYGYHNNVTTTSTTTAQSFSAFELDRGLDKADEMFGLTPTSFPPQSIRLYSVTPEYLIKNEKDDLDVLNRNLLISIDVDESVVGLKRELIGILEKVSTTAPLSTSGASSHGISKTSNSVIVEDRKRVDLFFSAPREDSYYGHHKTIYFPINLQSYECGSYKFTLNINTENGLVESNKANFFIIPPTDNIRKKRTTGDGGNDSGGEKDDFDEDNFDDYDNFDIYDHDFSFGDDNNRGNNDNFHFGAGGGGNDFGDFSRCRYCIVTEEEYLDEDFYDEGKGVEEDTNKQIIDKNDTLEEDNIDTISDTININNTRINDDNTAAIHDSFTAVPVTSNEVKGEQNIFMRWYSKHQVHCISFIVLTLALNIIVERARIDDGQDVILNYSGKIIEYTGLTDLSIRACTFLTFSDCSDSIKYISLENDITKSDYYQPIREALPIISPCIQSIIKLVLPAHTLFYFVFHTNNFYERDRFGFSGVFTVGILEIFQTLCDGYSSMMTLPIIAALTVLYVFEHIILVNFITRQMYEKRRMVYATVLTFSMYAVLLPTREWVAKNVGSDAVGVLPPCTIMFGTATQKIFSMGIPLLVGTRMKPSYAFDWVIALGGMSFILALVSSYAHIKHGEGYTELVATLCQIFPYYFAPLFASCVLNRCLQSCYILARNEVEKRYVGTWNRAENYVV